MKNTKEPSLRGHNMITTSGLFEKACTVLTICYIATQCWGIPLKALSGVNWGLWPVPSDIIWLAMLPVFAYIIASGRLRHPSLLPTTKALFLLILYALFSFGAAFFRFDLPTSQTNYLAYGIFRLLQAYTVWVVAFYTPAWQSGLQKTLRIVLITAGAVVAVAALLQQYSILDYRSLVAHLPPEPAISGPWAQRVVEPVDAALGTLNYNRIYAGHFLLVALLTLLLDERFTFVSVGVAAMFIAAILATQSRTAFVALGIGVLYALLSLKQLRGRMVVLIFLLAILVIPLVPSFFDITSQATISTRDDTLDESLQGRLERQQEGLDVAFTDFWSPIFGVGFGNLGYFWLGGGFSPAHGQFVTIMAELGFLGLLLVGLLYWRLLRGIKVTNIFTAIVAVVFVASIVSSVFNDLLLPSPAFGSYLGLLFALAGLALRASVGERV